MKSETLHLRFMNRISELAEKDRRSNETSAQHQLSKAGSQHPRGLGWIEANRRKQEGQRARERAQQWLVTLQDMLREINEPDPAPSFTDCKLWVGTWNMGNASPDADQLRHWLGVDRGLHAVYAVGLQESTFTLTKEEKRFGTLESYMGELLCQALGTDYKVSPTLLIFPWPPLLILPAPTKVGRLGTLRTPPLSPLCVRRSPFASLTPSRPPRAPPSQVVKSKSMWEIRLLLIAHDEVCGRLHIHSAPLCTVLLRSAQFCSVPLPSEPF